MVGKLLEQDNPDLGYDAANGIQTLQVENDMNLVLLSRVSNLLNIWCR